MKIKNKIQNISLKELGDNLAEVNFPSFRAKQVFDWIYKKNASSYDEMLNLPANLRDWLKENLQLAEIECLKRQKSQDNSEKLLFRIDNRYLLETVLIRGKKRNTVCLSSQIGCARNCLFCATGKDGLQKNLEPADIINQILAVQKITQEKISNVVFMGMGEPFDNYQNVLKSIQIINHQQGINIGARKITISTCGIIPGIIQLTNCPLQIELSVSLHSADDKVRTYLMPVNKKYPLKKLLQTCRRYVEKKNRQITFEYLMLKGINDSMEDAFQLCKLIAGFDAKINSIAYNDIENKTNLIPSAKDTILSFQKI
ncbi:MAG: 23S rRNA (adenine(2503)-C(2))-methyltransferase RlmN, partial [Atribacterota bacterium]|nr:23S rRNA (adenine(2503)-C(2))-methyltransferase RlmN [Atribacterota bacterium]